MDPADADPAHTQTSDATTTEPAVGGPGRWRRSALPVALVIVAAGALAWGLLRPAPVVETVGEVPAPVIASGPAEPPIEDTAVEEPREETQEERLACARPVVDSGRPVTISIPAIGVAAAPIESVAQEPNGEMEIPKNVAVIGWYEPSASFPDFPGVVPGAAEGTAVLSGHVDSRTQGRGVFYDLRLLDVGDGIEITRADGTVTRFVVTGRTSYGKEEIPLPDLFKWCGPPRLALITCGGEFDRAARSYTDNIVVLAVPA